MDRAKPDSEQANKAALSGSFKRLVRHECISNPHTLSRLLPLMYGGIFPELLLLDYYITAEHEGWPGKQKFKMRTVPQEKICCYLLRDETLSEETVLHS